MAYFAIRQYSSEHSFVRRRVHQSVEKRRASRLTPAGRPSCLLKPRACSLGGLFFFWSSVEKLRMYKRHVEPTVSHPVDSITCTIGLHQFQSTHYGYISTCISIFKLLDRRHQQAVSWSAIYLYGMPWERSSCNVYMIVINGSKS